MRTFFLKSFLLIICFTLYSPVFSQTLNDIHEDSLVLRGDFLCNIGNERYSSNLDSLIFYYTAAIPYYEKAKKWDYYFAVLNGCASMCYTIEDYEQSENYSLKALEDSRRWLGENSNAYLNALNNLSTVYFTKGNLNKAIEIQQEILFETRQNKKSPSKISLYYVNLANFLSKNGDVNKALEYSSKALQLYLDQVKIDKVELNRYYATHASVFEKKGQLDSSDYYNYKIVEELKLMPSTIQNTNRQIDTYLTLTKNNLARQRNKEAKLLLDRVFQLQQGEGAFKKMLSFELLGRIHLANGDLGKAEEATRKSIELIEKYAPSDLPAVSNKKLLLANILSEKGNTDEALTAFQNALTTLSFNDDKLSILENPSIETYFALNYVLNILEEKASFLWKIYGETKQLDYLQASLDTYEAASQVIQKMRQGFFSEESKKTLSEKTIPIYEGAIRSCYELFSLNNKGSYKEKALMLAERNKALLLLESINDKTAKGFANIPDSLLQKEKDLRINIAFYERKINEKIRLNVGDTGIEKLKSIAFEQKEELNQLNNNFEKNFPRYYNLKYKNDPTSINTIQQKLKGSNKAILEYFVGDDNIYLFVITSESVDVHKIENEAMVRQNVERLRQMIYNPPTTSFGIEEYTSFLNHSNNLYQELIQPATAQLNASITDLMIIPDFYLNYIPFDVLLTKPLKSESGNFALEALDYLMEDYNISYDYSATLHFKTKNLSKSNFTSDFVGFAPSFKNTEDIASRTCTSDELYSLKCSENEIQSIFEITDGQIFFGTDANRSTFESAINGSKIIHLATHACIDETNSNLNKIFLTDDYLSDFDLYNMMLNAELAVLSACNTGSGELVKGEGVLSLARGFINAGCSSTVMSMWSVDDCATSEIMIYFYEELKDGLSKEKALKAAKIKYLNSVDKSKKHPYYWAAFVPFGDMQSIEIGGGTPWFIYLLPFVLLLLVFHYFRGRNKV